MVGYQVSTFQAAVLLLFNDDDKLSFVEVKDRLRLPEEDVMRLLHSLACARYMVLTKEPPNKMVAVTDIFKFNADFTERIRRIKVCFH